LRNALHVRYKQNIKLSFYKGKEVLVTGGLGFIGSNLALRLLSLGARVTVVDSLVRGCGGHAHNLEPRSAEAGIVIADIGEPAAFADALSCADIVFNLAGEISHIHSMRFPERDLAINTISQLRFLQETARLNPGVRVVYASTRQIYGAPRYLPVDEQHPVQTIDFNGVHKYAATAYHQLFTAAGQLDAVVLCLTNVYGPRMGLDNPCQGFLANFIRRALTGQTIEIFGDGLQLRDPIYVDDLLDLFLLTGLMSKPPARLYNVGGPEVLSLSRIAELASAAAGAPAPVFREFPPDRKAIDIGSYSTDSSAVRSDLGWCASTSFEEGLALTFDFYRTELHRYLNPDVPNPKCKLVSVPAVKPAPAV
jgi:UDP-glucose 4-epimerase